MIMSEYDVHSYLPVLQYFSFLVKYIGESAMNPSAKVNEHKCLV